MAGKAGNYRTASRVGASLANHGGRPGFIYVRHRSGREFVVDFESYPEAVECVSTWRGVHPGAVVVAVEADNFRDAKRKGREAA